MRNFLTKKAVSTTTDSRLETRSLTVHSGSDAQTLSPVMLEKALREKRSSAYMDAIAKLDAGSHHSNPESIEALKEEILNQLPQARSLLLGIVSKCYLGHPYEVHTLDFFGQIVEHYKIGQSMKGELEKARSLAKHNSYQCIEVYSDKMIAIASDGRTSVLSLTQE